MTTQAMVASSADGTDKEKLLYNPQKREAQFLRDSIVSHPNVRLPNCLLPKCLVAIANHCAALAPEEPLISTNTL
ncbi:hypothetical protein L596_010748 [Steinernema carpocapsae]|uniref:Uncharacterized protein n=1 Tax=Steinernema carpocapsae TaxID=34508 RepID=A0A4U5PL69_STECR|nr:hypothetical protein L596_010748 [Steinernema carpocapsae]